MRAPGLKHRLDKRYVMLGLDPSTYGVPAALAEKTRERHGDTEAVVPNGVDRRTNSDRDVRALVLAHTHTGHPA